MRRSWQLCLRAFVLVAACCLPSVGAAQGTCQVNGFNATGCIAGGDAANSITFTITSAARLTLSTSVVTLPAPTDVSFNAGLSGAASVGYIIRANAPWALSIVSSAASWTATPFSARQDKPVGDLQWATTAGGSYADLTTTPVSVSSGPATAGTTLAVWFRTKLGWTLDSPGSYEIPVALVITAP